MRRYLTLLLVLGLVLAIGAVSSQAATQQLTFATGGTAGTYYPLGGAMAQLWNKEVPGINVSVQATGASVENMRLISKGQVDLAFIQNDITHYAYNGTETFKEKIRNFKVIGALYPETVQIVVREDSPYKTVSDLKGQRVSVGAPGSGVEANARQILSTFGLKYQDISPFFLSFAESADQLKNGQLDAVFVVAGHPTAAIQDIAAQHKIRVLEFSDSMVAKLSSKYRFYSRVTIPAGTYGMAGGVKTVGVKAILVCRPSLSNDLVYNLTKQLYENAYQLGHAKAREIKWELAKEGLSTPIHSGALKFFKEKGLK